MDNCVLGTLEGCSQGTGGVLLFSEVLSPLRPHVALPKGQAAGPCKGHDHHSASPIQVIQEVSGLPYEGAAEGNQYTPDAQRLNCQKVRLRPAQREGPILCRLSKNSELKWKASFFVLVLQPN